MEQPWRGKGGTMERNPSGSLKSSSQNCSKILGGSSSYQAKSKAGIFMGKQKQREPRFQYCWSSEEIEQLRRGNESTIERKLSWFLKSSLNCSKTHGETSSSQAKSKAATFMEKQEQREPSSESLRFLRPMELQRKQKGCTMERKPSGFLMSGKNCSKAHEEEKHPAFFKIMIGNFKNVLFIPPKFVGTIGDLVNQTLFLRDLHGHTWGVKLSVVNGHLAFQGGWDDFVMDHSIVAGEFLVFKYIGDSMFKVKIFGTSACNRIDFDEKVKKSSTTPKRKANEFPHENIHIPKRQKTCEFSEFRSKVGNHDSVMKRVRKEKTSSRKLFGKAFNPGKSVIHEKKKVPRKLERASAHAAKSGMLPTPFTSNYVGAPSHVIDEDAGEQEATRVCPVPFCEIPRDVVNKKEKNGTDLIDLCSPKLPYLLRSHSSEQNCCKNGLGDLVAHRFLLTKDGVCHIVDENLKDEIGASMLTPNDSLPSEKEKTECHKDKKPSSREHSLRHENVSNIPCTKPIIDLTKVEGGNNRSTSTKIGKKPQGKGVRPALMHRQDTPLFATGGYTPADMSRIQKHHKHPHIIKRNCRRSEEVKEKVIAPLKRNSIQVKLESLDEKDILPPALANFRYSFSFTAQTSWIVLPGNLPSQFSRMRHARQVIVLRDPSMRLWPVLYHEDSKFIGFIGGWEYFTRANQLRKGDLCRFEGAHLGSEFTLQVQITRA